MRLEQFKEYKKIINIQLQKISDELIKETEKKIGQEATMPVRYYADTLLRGGKRLRGSLAMFSYNTAGGKNQNMILEAVCAIEMLHTYILIIDDIQDRSKVRHNGSTVHITLAEKYKSDHIGISLALNAALIGAHEAQKILASLSVSPEVRLQIIHYVNNIMIATAHGQTGDMLNEINPASTIEDVRRIAALKTSGYTFESPLAVGLILAGKSDAVESIKPFAMHAGLLYQITDDIIGVFGDERTIGKSPMDDIREGKITFLSVYALNNLKNKELDIFKNLLGKKNLSKAEFETAKELITRSGALNYAKTLARDESEIAKNALNELRLAWTASAIQSLEQLVDQILYRGN
jgi:geranylgeranyl pyrophosphate synthase